MSTHFTPGRNIAIKTPDHEYSQLVAFYQNVIGLKLWKQQDNSTAFEFGDKILWVDRVPQITQAETWLEIRCEDLEQAKRHFKEHHIVFSQAVEPLPDGFPGFWIMAPGNVVHLVCND